MPRLGSSLYQVNNKIPYGVSWNESTDTYTTLGGVDNYLNFVVPCLVTPGSEGSGDIVLNPFDYTKRNDTGATVALDGSQGQVMMRFPKFYYSYSYSGSSHNYKVSLLPFAGSSVHSWFNKAGDGATFVPYRYIGVYPAVGYSSGSYQDGDGTNAWFNTSTGKLGSIAGKKSLTAFSRPNFRSAASRIGTGWSLMDFWGYAALKLLYITKYKNFNSQVTLGAGNTKFSSFTFATCISATGKVKSKTAPGQSTVSGNSGDYANLFGIEDLWGGVWQWVDGWNVNNGNNYICLNPSYFADGTTTNYTAYGVTNPTVSGWQNTLQQNVGFLCGSVGATSVTKITDYYLYDTGWVAPLFGGSADDGSVCGVFSLNVSGGASAVYLNYGGRVCF